MTRTFKSDVYLIFPMKRVPIFSRFSKFSPLLVYCPTEGCGCINTILIFQSGRFTESRRFCPSGQKRWLRKRSLERARVLLEKIGRWALAIGGMGPGQRSSRRAVRMCRVAGRGQEEVSGYKRRVGRSGRQSFVCFAFCKEQGKPLCLPGWECFSARSGCPLSSWWEEGWLCIQTH